MRAKPVWKGHRDEWGTLSFQGMQRLVGVWP